MNQIKFFKKMPFNFGIEVLGGNLFNLILKKSNLPIKVSSKVKTVMDNQPRINLKFYLGDRPIANANKFITEIQLKLLKPEKKGKEIDLEVRLSRAGEVNITLSDLVTKKQTCKLYKKNIYF